MPVVRHGRLKVVEPADRGALVAKEPIGQLVTAAVAARPTRGGPQGDLPTNSAWMRAYAAAASTSASSEVDALHAPARLARVVLHLDHGHLDRSSEGARVAEPGVVDEHQQHVRCALGRCLGADQVPVRLRAASPSQGEADDLPRLR